MSFDVMLPADDSRPAELREMSSERSAYEQVREMICDIVEIVRARGLHYLAPGLWPVMVVDDNGHGKGSLSAEESRELVERLAAAS